MTEKTIDQAKRAEQERLKADIEAIAKIKFVPLTQRHINTWCDALPPPEEVVKLRGPKYNFILVQAAAKAGWFDPPIDPEKIEDMRPAEVRILYLALSQAYAAAEYIDPS